MQLPDGHLLHDAGPGPHGRATSEKSAPEKNHHSKPDPTPLDGGGDGGGGGGGGIDPEFFEARSEHSGVVTVTTRKIKELDEVKIKD